MKKTDNVKTILHLQNKDYIYSSLTKDLYFLGIVLERKYRILRWTYTIFMTGMVLSVIVFGIALKFFGPERLLELPVMQPSKATMLLLPKVEHAVYNQISILPC